MAIVNRNEFAAIAGIDVKTLNVYISRKKVSTIQGNKSLIDTLNPLNVIFVKNVKKTQKEKVVKERQLKKITATSQNANDSKKEISNELQEIKKQIEENYIKAVDIYTPVETNEQKKAREKQNESDNEVVSWDLRKKIADALKAEEQANLAAIQVQKLTGKLIPVDLVKLILKVNIQDILRTFEGSLVNIASIYCDVLAGGDREKLAELVTKLRHELNSNVQRIKQTAASEITNAIDDFIQN